MITTADAFSDIDLPLPDRRAGKVRVSYALPNDRRLFVTTDRLSAFDRILAAVPFKGQVLNQLAWWWFEHTRDIVANHALALPDPNALIARAATPLPVEVVVRGHITGVTPTSLWRRYDEGARVIDGYRFVEGLRKNSELPVPIVTPTTKAHAGHDEPLSVAAVVERGLVPEDQWMVVVDTALALFNRGRRLAAVAGLILADTKYEFGIGPDGELLLIDEIHTPDSSRYWEADSYAERLTAGDEPESLDKEVVRRAMIDAGYGGDGEPPTLDASVWLDTSHRYIRAYERVAGESFAPGRYPVPPRLQENLRIAGILP